jgi:CRP-like cAMP-binding protein
METLSELHKHQSDFHELIAQMSRHPFLQGLSAEHLGTLALYAMQTEFAPGQWVFRQGDLANRFYLVQSGRVALEAVALNRRPVTIQVLGAGEVLGWSWLFEPYQWRFDARALEPTKAIFFYGTRLREHCEEDLRFGHEILQRVTQVAIQRLQAVRQRLLD